MVADCAFPVASMFPGFFVCQLLLLPLVQAPLGAWSDAWGRSW